MSGKVFGGVFKIKLSPTDQRVLLALADEADPEGTVCASVGYIAWKVAISERQTQRAIKALCDQGLLVQVAKAAPGRGITYRIDLAAGEPKTPYIKKGGTTMTPQAVANGDVALAPNGRQNYDTQKVTELRHPKGDISRAKGDISRAKGDMGQFKKGDNPVINPVDLNPVRTYADSEVADGDEWADVRAALESLEDQHGQKLTAKQITEFAPRVALADVEHARAFIADPPDGYARPLGKLVNCWRSGDPVPDPRRKRKPPKPLPAQEFLEAARRAEAVIRSIPVEEVALDDRIVIMRARAAEITATYDPTYPPRLQAAGI